MEDECRSPSGKQRKLTESAVRLAKGGIDENGQRATDRRNFVCDKVTRVRQSKAVRCEFQEQIELLGRGREAPWTAHAAFKGRDEVVTLHASDLEQGIGGRVGPTPGFVAIA